MEILGIYKMFWYEILQNGDQNRRSPEKIKKPVGRDSYSNPDLLIQAKKKEKYCAKVSLKYGRGLADGKL